MPLNSGISSTRNLAKFTSIIWGGRGKEIVVPKNKLVVITGPSGSGKSTLAFDTIYAEGQRMYPRGPQGMGMASGLADIRLNQLLG